MEKKWERHFLAERSRIFFRHPAACDFLLLPEEHCLYSRPLSKPNAKLPPLCVCRTSIYIHAALVDIIVAFVFVFVVRVCV